MSETRTLGIRRGSIRSLRATAGPLAKTALMRLGGYAAVRRLRPSRQLAILRYHAICGSEGYSYADPAICITPASFEEHVAYLTRAYAVVRLEDAVRALADEKPLPPNAVAITFDDGYADNFAAARTLAKYGASATFYLTAGCLAGGEPFWPAELRHLLREIRDERITVRAGATAIEIDLISDQAREAALRRLTKLFKSHPIPVRDDMRQQLRDRARTTDLPRIMLTWDEVREMHAMGMTIGSHTMTHPNLPSAGLDAARDELVRSRQRLEHELGCAVTMFSYPNGGAEQYMTGELSQVVRETSYTAAVTSRNAFAGRHSDLYALERIEVQEALEHLVFALEVERFAFKPRPRPSEKVDHGAST
jgi:peptidoglycan/xylan/chitin deacetylase (PgdA/CDA1 family)